MTNLIRLEDPNRPEIGGFQITFPSGATKRVHWSSQTPIHDTLAAAKQYAASVLDALMKEGRIDDADRTNWVSVTAAVQAVIKEWNAVRERAIRGSQPGGLIVDERGNVLQ